MRRTLHDLSPSNQWTHLRGSESFIAGAGAGLVSSVVTCPLDVVKTKLQAQGASPNRLYHGLVGTIRVIVRDEGLRGLYRGLGPTVYGYLPTWGIYFAVYDLVKAQLAKRSNVTLDDEGVGAHIVAALTAGATGTTLTNPIWVVKTRFQTQPPSTLPADRYRSTLDCLRRIYREDGARGFYRGLVPSLMGVGHVAIQFPLYEHFKRQARGDSNVELAPPAILLCSSSSKMIASVLTYPHEVIRTRLQLARSFGAADGAAPALTVRRDGIMGTFRSIWRGEGFTGFYRGLSVNLVRTVPASAMTILTYEMLMRRLQGLTGASTVRSR